jgi:hypothetical protein
MGTTRWPETANHPSEVVAGALPSHETSHAQSYKILISLKSIHQINIGLSAAFGQPSWLAVKLNK